MVQVLLCPEKSRPQENKEKVLLGYTAMVDAWAMGILAYELTVGRPPFEKQSRAATYEHIMYRKPEFPTNMSPDAKNFVFTALTKVLHICVCNVPELPKELQQVRFTAAESWGEEGSAGVMGMGLRGVGDGFGRWLLMGRSMQQRSLQLAHGRCVQAPM